jgi:GxxExxY protein
MAMEHHVLIDRALTERILKSAFEVHTQLGPGLLESAYRRCLLHELQLGGMRAKSEVAVPLTYKGLEIDCTYRADILVEGRVMLELKAVEAILPIHKAQLLTYLKLSKIKLGFLLNFHSVHLRDGFCRLIA